MLAGCYCQAKGDKATATHRLRLGIDVMKMEYSGGKSVHEFFRLMDRNFTDQEWRYIRSGRDREDLVGRFMRVWCLKESYVKNIGVGITVDLRKIHFKVTSPLGEATTPTNVPNLSTKVRLNGRTQAEDNWNFEETRLDQEHCVAVAIVDDNESYTPCNEGFRFIDIEWLIENIDPLRREDEIEEDLCGQVLRKDVK